MKRLQFLAAGRACLGHAHAPVEAALGELREKGGMAIGPEGMAVAEPVTRQAFARYQQNGSFSGQSPSPSLLS
jgi:hypothetical protein